MLVLSRRINETIVINHQIKVMIVDIRGDKIRIGVEAPPEISVNRLEVEEAILREHKANIAAAGDGDENSPRPARPGLLAALRFVLEHAAELPAEEVEKLRAVIGPHLAMPAIVTPAIVTPAAQAN